MFNTFNFTRLFHSFHIRQQTSEKKDVQLVKACETSYLPTVINQRTVENLWSGSILLKLHLNKLIKSVTFEKLSPKKSCIVLILLMGINSTFFDHVRGSSMNVTHFCWG